MSPLWLINYLVNPKGMGQGKEYDLLQRTLIVGHCSLKVLAGYSQSFGNCLKLNRVPMIRNVRQSRAFLRLKIGQREAS